MGKLVSIVDFPYCGTIGWGHESVSNPLYWNRLCADVVEQFGLPGDKYVTRVDFLKMDFYFRNEQDLLLFKLKWSEYEF